MRHRSAWKVKQVSEFVDAQRGPLRNGAYLVLPAELGQHGNQQQHGQRVAYAPARSLVGQPMQLSVHVGWINGQRFVGQHQVERAGGTIHRTPFLSRLD